MLDPNDEGIDDEGNTSIHHLTKNNQDLENFGTQIQNQPHMLFMLNKQGLLPLDMTIAEKDEPRSLKLIEYMKSFNNNCSLKFVKRPHRLDLKFEKSFCLAILKNNLALLDAFPSKQIKTAFVSMS